MHSFTLSFYPMTLTLLETITSICLNKLQWGKLISNSIAVLGRSKLKPESICKMMMRQTKQNHKHKPHLVEKGSILGQNIFQKHICAYLKLVSIQVFSSSWTSTKPILVIIMFVDGFALTGGGHPQIHCWWLTYHCICLSKHDWYIGLFEIQCMWDVITHGCPNFNGNLIKPSLMDVYIPRKTMGVISHACLNLSLTAFVRWAPDL